MTSNVTCDYTASVWEVNSAGQNACQVYAQLQGQCDPSFIIQSVLATSPAYTPPNNECGCNVVAYNLQAGCGWCQQPIQSGWWLTINQWAGNCTNVPYNPSALPASISTASITIPRWALAIPTGTTWESSQASIVAVGTTTASSTSTIGFSFASTGAATTNRASNGQFSGNGTALAGVSIAGIMIGVLLGLWLLLTVAMVGVYFLRDSRRKTWYAPMGAFYSGKKAGYGGGYGYGSYAPNNYPGAGGSAVPLTYPAPGTAYATTNTPSSIPPANRYQPPPNGVSGSAGPVILNSSPYVQPPAEWTHYGTPIPPGSQGGMGGWIGHPVSSGSSASVHGTNGGNPYAGANTSSIYGSQTALAAASGPGGGGSGVPAAQGAQGAIGYRGHAEVY